MLSSQCAPVIFNLDQKFHVLSWFGGIYIHETVQNQSRKISVIRLPKFTIVNMVRKWHQHASFSIELVFWRLLSWKPNDRCLSMLSMVFIKNFYYFFIFKKTSPKCTPGIFYLDQKLDFLAFGALIYRRQFRISQEKYLSSGFQNSLLQTWLENAIKEQVLV